MKKLISLQNNSQGSILLVFILTMPFLILLATYYMNESLTSYSVARLDQEHTEAQLAADAGADYGIEQIALNNSWTGTGGPVTLQNDGQFKVTYSDSVASTPSDKTITITGNTYFPTTASSPRRSVTVYVDLYPVTSGNYSIAAGTGGLYMSNSAKVVGGSVLINGQLQMSNTSQIGLEAQPVNVQVADDICPLGNNPGASYPEVCSSGSPGPISLTNSAHIYGQVQATNQTSGTGMSDPGLESGNPSPQALPTYNRLSQINAVSTTMTAAAASCNSKNGTVTWPANVKITGNVSISNNCAVSLLGNAWITGNLSAKNTASMTVSSTLGSSAPVVMVDGSSGIDFSNSFAVTANNSNTGAQFYTFYSTNSCTTATTSGSYCASLSGNDLYNSRTVDTITLDNSFSGAYSLFDAYWTQNLVKNSGQIGALIGQTINMSNTASVTFGSQVPGQNTIWVVKGYRR